MRAKYRYLCAFASTALDTGLGAGGAVAWMAGQGACVNAASQTAAACLAAGPGRRGAALHGGAGLPAVAGDAHRLRTGRTRSCNTRMN